MSTTTAIENETFDIEVCVDCLMMLANGTIGGDASEAAEAAHVRFMEMNWPSSEGWVLAPACPENCDGHFSWSQCDGCNTRLGGDRHPAVAFKR